MGERKTMRRPDVIVRTLHYYFMKVVHRKLPKS